ncbi:MAG: F0F1 ATP synthase subunit delta [Marinibacterium sp.]
MSEPASISAGIAKRYASAIFELAKDNSDLEALEAGVNDLAQALSESDDLNTLISSPLISREDQAKAITALAEKMGLTDVLAKGLGLMAEKRRLFVLPQLLDALRAMIAEERNEVTAEVTSALPLTKAQTTRLAAELKKSAGRDVNIQTIVDESLVGGLIVTLGSKMVDTSIRSKLASLQNAMKEVG